MESKPVTPERNRIVRNSVACKKGNKKRGEGSNNQNLSKPLKPWQNPKN